MTVLTMDAEEKASAAPTRRDVLRLGLGGVGLAALHPVARAAASLQHRSRMVEPFLVVVELQGGNDGLNTVVPHTLASYTAARPSLALSPGQCLTMNAGPWATDRWGLHPSLAHLATLWSAGSVAVVPKVGYPRPNFSHFSSGDVWSYGVRDVASLPGGASGWIARYVDAEGLGPLGAVSVGMGRPRAFVGGASDPLLVRDLGSFEFQEDSAYRANHGLRLELVRGMLAANAQVGTAALNQQAIEQGHALADRIQGAVDGYSSTAAYGTSAISRRLRDIAVLLQADFETRIFYTGFGGFDTHGAQGTVTGTHANLLAQLDEALGAFSQDLQAMGLWDRAIVVVVSEFGRRTAENGSGGTDHGGGNHVLALGGAVRGGVRGPELVEGDLEPRNIVHEVDFRSIYKEILSGHLGAGAGAIAAVFPEAQEHDGATGLV